MDKNSEYGRIYSEICNGFSKQLIGENYIYFKHPTLSEHFANYSNYEVLISEGRKKGLLSEEEKILEAISGGWWANDNESNINFLKKTIENLNKTKSKLLYPSQKLEIEKQIKKNEAILISYSKDRNEIIGYCLEHYAHERFMEQLLIFFTYRDADCKEKFFETSHEYYELTENDVDKIKSSFNTYSSVFDIRNIKCVGACGFFQNLVYLDDEPNSFWGKPTVKCTKYQIDTLLYGKMYKNFIKNYRENNKPLSDEIISDPEKLVEWIDNQNNPSSAPSKIKKSKTPNENNTVTSYVGATQDDLKEMGVKIEKIGGKSLLQLVAEKGGELDKNDYLNLRENL